MAKQTIMIWYDIDADESERGYWRTLRKLIDIGENPNTDYIEIYNASELMATEEKLGSEGWTKIRANDYDPPVYKKSVLTLWEKNTEEA